MARIRSVKPELRTSLTVAEWPREVRYFWVLLWGYLDDYGRGVDEPRLVKADCFPLDDDLAAADIDKWLDLFVAAGSLCRYVHGGRRFMHAVNWRDHQKPQHPKDSKIPPCEQGDCGAIRRDLHEDLTKPHESLSGNGVGNTPSPSSHGEGGDGDGVGDGEGGSQNDERPGADLNEGRDDVERLCVHLADRIEGNGTPRPKITKDWRDAVRLMIDKEKRTEEQIRRAIDWCQDDEFWRSNILSMPKLRKQYDQMRLQADAQRKRGSPPNGSAPGSGQRNMPRPDEYGKGGTRL